MQVTKAYKHHITTRARWPIHSILDFWGRKVHKKGRVPAFDAEEPLCKIWHR